MHRFSIEIAENLGQEPPFKVRVKWRTRNMRPVKTYKSVLSPPELLIAFKFFIHTWSPIQCLQVILLHKTIQHLILRPESW